MFGVALKVFAARDPENARIPEVLASAAASPIEKRSDNIIIFFPFLSINYC
jgi:hypothetical protein